uniref:MADS-box domain-containing protein n=1 Tax=Oryza brachyantha TaxID=4533 RepID=J3LQE5_ORYBR
MACKKVNLQHTTDDATRQAIYKKRCKDLMKKVRELSSLHGVDACIVVYSEDKPQVPELWPSMAATSRIIERFKSLPLADQHKNMTNLENFLKQCIAELQEKVDKLEKKNEQRETMLLLHKALAGRLPSFVGLTTEQLTRLNSMVHAKLTSVEERLKVLRAGSLSLQGCGMAHT